MIAFIFILVVIVVSSIRKRHDDFMSHKQTTIINGIFVLLIFLSHSTQYINLSDECADTMYRHFQNIHSQWVVTTFLAFSGYGVMVRIKNSGVQYLRGFPRNRLLKTLVNYDIAVLLFLVVNLLLGIYYKPLTIVLSFIGLEGIGNSNWYIFTILLMYMVSFMSAIVWQKNYKALAAFVMVGSFLYVLIGHLTGLQSRFVSTVVTYSLGMWIALYRNDIETLFNEKLAVSFVLIVIPIILTYKMRSNDYVMNINSCFFVLLVVLFMAHFEIRSKVLHFIGKHAFSIYILQRLPMLIISRCYSKSEMPSYLFVVVCFVITVGLAVTYDKVLKVVDKKIVLC